MNVRAFSTITLLLVAVFISGKVTKYCILKGQFEVCDISVTANFECGSL